MMGSCNYDKEDDRFFDTQEDIVLISDSGSDCPEKFGPCSSPGFVNLVSDSSGYEVWIKKPGSVDERRDKFFKRMGIDNGKIEDSDELSGAVIPVEMDRITENSGAVLGSSDSEGFSSSRSYLSSWSSETRDSSSNRALEDNFLCRIRNLDDGTEYFVDEMAQDGMLGRLREAGTDRLVTFEEFQCTLGLSPSAQHLMQREANVKVRSPVETTKKLNRSWLRRLRAFLDRQGRGGRSKLSDYEVTSGARVRKVRVRSHKKRLKELSALYVGQEIHAHEGSILSMKFSPDGHYLASAGEDGIVRVWEVIVSQRSIEYDIPEIDPSCVYFTVNKFSELAPLFSSKETFCNFKSLRKSDTPCVIFPPKVFRLSEKPLHEFHGHSGEILDLSWSTNKHLLSASVDQTVRLWRVGCNQCLKVFSHNNYVTCIQFNPVDDNFFISGSIDGKVRIWGISGGEVVDWTDIKEIVTAVCYRPDGQGGIVGSMAGNCYIYNAPDNHLQLDAEICLRGKKKSPGKRITGFQFPASDPGKLMVTSADSQVRILDGLNVICKYKGLKNTGSQISASFSLDEKHIISASEDSNVYVWNYNKPARSPVKSIWSSERFFSSNASVAIPWCGLRCGSSVVSTTVGDQHVSNNTLETIPENGLCDLNKSLFNSPPLSSPGRFSLGHGVLPETLPKGSATWPEEKLPKSTSLVVSSALRKSHYRFLKSSCQNTFSSPHAWCLVIVTAGWDGRIRSFRNYGLPIRL